MRLTCPWPSVCTCLHIGCVAGWLDLIDKQGREYAEPCPNCRPEVAQQLRYGLGSLSEVRGRLPRVARPSRERAPTT